MRLIKVRAMFDCRTKTQFYSSPFTLIAIFVVCLEQVRPVIDPKSYFGRVNDPRFPDRALTDDLLDRGGFLKERLQ